MMLGKCNKICLVVAIVFTFGKLSSLQPTTANDYTLSLTKQFNEADPNYCTLICTVNSPNIYKYEWTYYSQNPQLGIDVQITDGINITSNDTHTCSTLTQDPYYAGYYYCSMYVSQDKTMQLNDFIKIDMNNPGQPIDGFCDDETDCLALNSNCTKYDVSSDQKYCTCSGENDINPYNAAYTPICVPPRNEGENCTYNEQCAKYTEDYYCTAGVCKCEGTKTPIAELSNQMMCIAGVPLTFPCFYDEQCTLVTSDSKCDITCECQQGFVNTNGINNYEWYCDDSLGLTGGQIAGIVIGSLAGVSIICSAVYFVWSRAR